MKNNNPEKVLELIKETIKYHSIEKHKKGNHFKTEHTGFLKFILGMASGQFSDKEVEIQLDYIKARYNVELHLSKEGEYTYFCTCGGEYKNAQSAAECDRSGHVIQKGRVSKC